MLISCVTHEELFDTTKFKKLSDAAFRKLVMRVLKKEFPKSSWFERHNMYLLITEGRAHC